MWRDSCEKRHKKWGSDHKTAMSIMPGSPQSTQIVKEFLKEVETKGIGKGNICLLDCAKYSPCRIFHMFAICYKAINFQMTVYHMLCGYARFANLLKVFITRKSIP